MGSLTPESQKFSSGGFLYLVLFKNTYVVLTQKPSTNSDILYCDFILVMFKNTPKGHVEGVYFESISSISQDYEVSLCEYYSYIYVLPFIITVIFNYNYYNYHNC